MSCLIYFIRPISWVSSLTYDSKKINFSAIIGKTNQYLYIFSRRFNIISDNFISNFNICIQYCVTNEVLIFKLFTMHKYYSMFYIVWHSLIEKITVPGKIKVNNC